MAGRRFKISPFHSLRTQLCAGAIGLLGVTVASISYFLIQHEIHILKHEIERSVILQGRNIALSSEKALLRSDPEFELFPLVKTLLASSESIRSVVITDSEGIIYGHEELQHVSKKLEMDLRPYERTSSGILHRDEALYRNDTAFVLVTPVRSLDRTIGHVQLTYSKRDLNRSIRRAIAISIISSAFALGLGIVLSLILFRRISHPMRLLMDGVSELGEGRFTTRINLSTKNEFRVLAESFNDMAERIARAQEELVIKERMERELEIARDIQGTLIPTEVPQPDGYEVAVYFNSATEVGGDYLDVIPVDSETLSLVTADVSGKGVPGLVVMGMLKIMVHTLISRRLSPGSLIRELNISIKKALKPNMFVTFFIANVNTRSGEVVYSNAGHNPLVIYDGNTKRCGLHKMGGPPLGIFPAETFDSEINEYRTTVGPGGLILQYTDGLNESTNENGEQFSLDRIISVCNVHASSGATSLVPNLAKAEQRFRRECPQTDDIAVLAISAKERVPAGNAVDMI